MDKSRYELIFLDFDGVIVDSIEECIALTWFAGRDVEASSLKSLFGQVPNTFRKRFWELRPFSRTLDDFAVARFGDADTAIGNQYEFDQVKKGLGAPLLDQFVDDANRLRTYWRQTDRESWIDAHYVFEGISDLIRRYSKRCFVITAKDVDSTMEILSYFGLDIHVEQVVGECDNKAEAVSKLCAQYDANPKACLFIDDNIVNVVGVYSAGVASKWADWGWATDDEVKHAFNGDISPVMLKDLRFI